MVKVFVMTYDTGKLQPASISEETKKDVTEKVGNFLKENPDVKFNGLWVNDDGIGICDWEAPNAEMIKKAVEAVGLPHDEVIEVKKVMP